MRIRNTVYLDHQATTPIDPRVLAEMAPYYSELIGNPHSSDHSLGWASARAVEDAATRVARLIGADADEIIFTSGATEANNLGLLGLCRRAAGGHRRRVLVSAIEHKCVLAVGGVLQEQLGYEVEYIPVDAAGSVEMSTLQEALADDVLVVSVMAVNNEIGTIQDIPTISQAVREVGALLHCDAAQAPCAMDLRGFSDLVDLLSLSSHKMYGPQGIGALFILRDLQDRIEPLIYGGGQQRTLRSGTVPVALCVGMGSAATLLDSHGGKEQREALCARRNAFVRRLMSLSWPIIMNGPECQQRHPGNANMRFSGFDAHGILSALQPRLAASTGSACTSGIAEPSHVLRAMGLSGEDAEASIRFSLGCGTTEADIEEAVQIIDETLSKLAHAEMLHSGA
jgi:cysteine desulfurase